MKKDIKPVQQYNEYSEEGHRNFYVNIDTKMIPKSWN